MPPYVLSVTFIDTLGTYIPKVYRKVCGINREHFLAKRASNDISSGAVLQRHFAHGHCRNACT